MKTEHTPITTAVFDFDGTLSTLRHGWEQVMQPLMEELIAGSPEAVTEALHEKVRTYIDTSTGIQTIHQMKWLAAEVAKRLPPEAPECDPWYLKKLYDIRLMESVSRRREALRSGCAPETYLILGAKAFLEQLKAAGVTIYAASGTDETEVQAEAALLGIDGYFTGIYGAKPRSEGCSKAEIIERLIREGDTPASILVVGDGRVEIELGRAAGCHTLGIASDEDARHGINKRKLERLRAAGADTILGDFAATGDFLASLGIARRNSEDPLDISGVTTYSASTRRNLVTIENMSTPGVSEYIPYEDPDFSLLCEKIIEARKNGRPVIWSMGAHVVKNRLSRYVIGLMKAGIITHIAGNGAVSIHDFELCYLGGTSEDVPTAIEDGSFGMWEETGRMMNEALIGGAIRGDGYGTALAKYMDLYPERFPNREDCILYQAYKLDIPATYHIALGTDIIHQHPLCDMSAIGKCSQVDFKKYCRSVSLLEGGVFLNFGSAVIGAEVFLKALSICRNLGYPSFHITTANLDLVPLGNYRSKIGYDDPNYYYRPRKNIVNRPTSMGGIGWHFCADHLSTIPTLYHKVLEGK